MAPATPLFVNSLETPGDAATLDALCRIVLSPTALAGGTISLEALAPDHAASGAGGGGAVSAPTSPAAGLGEWERWASALPAALPPAALGLPHSADALSAAHAGADALRTAATILA
jgi:hypothetical protein